MSNTINNLKRNIANTATTLNTLINYKMKNKDLQNNLKKELSARLLTLCAKYLKATHNETKNLTTTNTLSSYLLNTLPKDAANYFITKLNLD